MSSLLDDLETLVDESSFDLFVTDGFAAVQFSFLTFQKKEKK